MTKYEWEIELKKHMGDLPRGEQERVLEYYNELFADGMESGKSEKQLVSEFGNPVDVAYRIIAEYGMDERGGGEREPSPPDTELNRPTSIKPESPPDFWKGRGAKKSEPVKEEEEKKTVEETPAKEKQPIMNKQTSIGGKLCALVAEAVLVGWLPITLIIVIASLLLSVIVVGGVLAVGSIMAVIAACMPGLVVGARIVTFAMAFVCAGLSLLILPNTLSILKAIASSSIGLIKGFFGWVLK